VPDIVLVTILGMAAVTYATRASGLYLGRRFRIPPWLDTVLTALPGAIVVSLVAPEVVSAGVPGVAGAVVAATVAALLRDNIVVPMAAGVAVDVALRFAR
jgi:uncharacterized membrane protein